jgi:2-oxoglutarate dehydrogenase E1 component
MIGPVKSFLELSRDTLLTGANVQYLEELYARYVNDPQSVDGQWRDFFAGLQHRRLETGAELSAESTAVSYSEAEKQGSVLRIINAHRVHQRPSRARTSSSATRSFGSNGN